MYALFLDTLKSSSFYLITEQGSDRCSTGVFIKYQTAVPKLGLAVSGIYTFIGVGFYALLVLDWDGHAIASECGTSTDKTLHAFLYIALNHILQPSNQLFKLKFGELIGTNYYRYEKS